jgi:hypothetical protein
MIDKGTYHFHLGRVISDVRTVYDGTDYVALTSPTVSEAYMNGDIVISDLSGVFNVSF